MTQMNNQNGLRGRGGASGTRYDYQQANNYGRNGGNGRGYRSNPPPPVSRNDNRLITSRNQGGMNRGGGGEASRAQPRSEASGTEDGTGLDTFSILSDAEYNALTKNGKRRYRAKLRAHEEARNRGIPTTGFETGFEQGNGMSVNAMRMADIEEATEESQARTQTQPVTEFNYANRHMRNAPLAHARRERHVTVVTPQVSRSEISTLQSQRTAPRLPAYSSPPPVPVPPYPQPTTYLNNNNYEVEPDLPDLEDVPTTTIEELTRIATSNVNAPTSETPIRDRLYLNDENKAVAKEIIRNPAKFYVKQLDHLSIKDTVEVLSSVAVLNLVKHCGVESNYEGMMKTADRIRFASLDLQSRVATKDNEARWYGRTLSIPFYGKEDMRECAPIDFVDLLGKKKIVEIKSGSPSLATCQRAMEMVVRRIWPDRTEVITNHIKSQNLSPAKYLKNLTEKGALYNLLALTSDIDLTPNPPRISCLIKLQEEVDDERSDSMEDTLSVTFSTSGPGEEEEDESQQEPARSNEVTINQPNIRELDVIQEVVVDEDQYQEQMKVMNASITPMADLASYCRSTGNDIVLSRSRYRESLELIGIVATAYGDMKPHHTSNLTTEMNFDMELLDFRSASITQEQRKEILLQQVLLPYTRNHFPAASAVLEFCLGRESPEKIIQLSCVKSQFELWIKDLDLAFCRRIEAPKTLDQRDGTKDYFHALEDQPTSSILQVELDSRCDPTAWQTKVEQWCASLGERHSIRLNDWTELRPNLSETEYPTVKGNYTIRIYIKASFDFKKFIALHPDESSLRSRFEALMQHAGGGYSVEQTCNDEYLPTTLLPGIGLEQSKDGLLEKIESIPKLFTPQGDIELEWANIQRGKETVKMMRVNSEKDNVVHVGARIQRFTFQGIEIDPIEAFEKLETPYLQDTFLQHQMSTQDKQVISVTGIPAWFYPESCTITEAIVGSEIPVRSNGWSVLQLLRSLSSDGGIAHDEGRVFRSVTKGHRSGSLALEYNEGMGRVAWNLRCRITEILENAMEQSSQDIVFYAYPPIETAEKRPPLEAMQVQQEAQETQSKSSDSSVDSEETPEQDRKMPVVIAENTPMSQEMINITSRLDGVDHKLCQMTTSLTDLSTSVSSITTYSPPSLEEVKTLVKTLLDEHRERQLQELLLSVSSITKHTPAPSLEEVKSLVQTLLNEQREKQLQDLLQSDTVNGIVQGLKSLSTSTLVPTHRSDDTPQSSAEKTFQSPSKGVFGNVYAEQGVDKSLSSAVRHVEQCRQEQTQQSDSSKQSLFQNVTKTSGHLKSPTQFFTPAGPKITGEENEEEEIDFQAGQVSNLTDNTKDSAKSPLKPTALENDLDEATMVEGSTIAQEEATEESLNEEAPELNEAPEQHQEESRAAQLLSRRSARIQKKQGNNEDNQNPDESHEGEVARGKSSSKKQNDIRNYYQ